MDYDRQKSRTWKSSQGFGKDVFDELLTAFEGFRHRLVLEVGVGSGRNALLLLDKIKAELIGLDLSKEMLKLARVKMSPFKDQLSLILADGEHLPFVDHAFDAVICMSTMHYFASQSKILHGFREALRENGKLVYGDLTVHETDNRRFFEGLEKTLSKAHARYYKPSEIKKLISEQGFNILRIKTIGYQKSYNALMEDKGRYFAVAPETLNEYIEGATAQAREQYALTQTDMTLFYTVITAKKENRKHVIP